MKLSNKYKSSEYLFLFSILVLALLLGTYFSFYAFLWRDIKSDIKGFSKDIGMNYMNYQEGMSCTKKTNTNTVESMNPGPRQGTGMPMNFNPKNPPLCTA
jgi:hypothetical protein